MSTIFPTPVLPGTHSTYVARIAFDHGERHFELGEPFPAEALGVEEYRVAGMWTAGLILVDPPKKQAAPATAPAKGPTP